MIFKLIRFLRHSFIQHEKLMLYKETFLFRDKGTTGRPVPDCPGTSRGTSRPLETLMYTV